jgi:uncharacterized membrane protein YkvA (DUF1232 family)
MISPNALVQKLESVKNVAANFATEMQVYKRILQDPRTPRMSKALLGCAALYAVAPIDLVPDVLPVVGQIDDAFVISSFVVLGLSLLPEGMVNEHRLQVKRDAEIRAFERSGEV